MQAQVIIVHDIQKAIEDVGIKPYANTLVQEMGGNYYYIEVDINPDDIGIWGPLPGYEQTNWAPGRAARGNDWWNTQYVKNPEYFDGCNDTLNEDEDIILEYVMWCYRKIKIPNSLAWFIIDCLKLKADAIRLGSTEYKEVSQAVYLTPGKEIFGHKVEKLTEIPAELMPVVVERL
jgi:hypothetical protein